MKKYVHSCLQIAALPLHRTYLLVCGFLLVNIELCCIKVAFCKSFELVLNLIHLTILDHKHLDSILQVTSML